MTWSKRKNGIRAALLILPMVSLGGCIDYTIDTTLQEDGSGLRDVRIEVTDAEDLEDLELTTQDLMNLMFVSEGQGWAHATEVQEGGDTSHIFRRESRVTDLNSWSDLNDDIHIAGALPSRSASTVGYVTLGDVNFRNRVLVGTSRQSDGSASFSYRETFSWENAVDALLEIIVEEFDRTLQDSYPDLGDQELGEILGFARARLWVAVEEGVLDASGDEEDRLWERAIDRTADQTIEIVRKRYPTASKETLKGELESGLGIFSDNFPGDTEGELEDRILETLPGLGLAINSAISFRLTMPGRVTNTNAHEQDGNTLEWEFAPTDALTAPIVILAESVVGG